MIVYLIIFWNIYIGVGAFFTGSYWESDIREWESGVKRVLGIIVCIFIFPIVGIAAGFINFWKYLRDKTWIGFYITLYSGGFKWYKSDPEKRERVREFAKKSDFPWFEKQDRIISKYYKI